MKQIVFLLLVSASSAFADGLSCRGSELSFDLTLNASDQVTALSKVQARDKKLTADLKESAGHTIRGPEATGEAQLPTVYQGEFHSPSPGYTGTWTLVLNPQNGRAEFAYDDDDGDVRSFDLNCAKLL